MSEETSNTPKICAAWLALLCWVIFCLTTGQLHTACRRDDLPTADRISLFTAAGISGQESCAYTLGWPWMVIFLTLVSTLLAGLALLYAPRLHVGALAWVCLSSCFIWRLADSYLNLHYGAEVYPSSRSAAAASAAVAGPALCAFSNFILIVTLGWTAAKW